MISREITLEINYFNNQGLSYRALSRKTGLDRRTVKRYAENPDLIGKSRISAPRSSKLDPFLPSIKNWLEEDEYYTATWIYDRLVKMGFDGGRTIVKDAVHEIKSENRRLAYARFETDPGRQAQVDFGDFKVVEPDGTEKTYYLFAMILGYSRMLYCELLERCDMVSFLDAHQRAFAYFGGVPGEILYDRMRNVYIGKLAGKDTFTQGMINLSCHYGFNPIVAPAYAPWVKGKIERPMDFIREGFWRGYELVNLAAANRDLMSFCEEKSHRIHGTTHEKVIDRFEREKQFLLPLSHSTLDVSEKLYRKVAKDCTISVDGSRYEVPYTLVGKKIVVRMKDGILRIFDDNKLVVTLDQSPVKGGFVCLAGLIDAIRADRRMNERKWRCPKRGKGKATRSPIAGKYDLDVQVRDIDTYASIGGEVAYA